MQTKSKDSRIRTYPAQRGIVTPSLTSNYLVLIQRWRRSIQLKRRSWQSDALFRSLAVAFHAARLPKGSDNELFDLGIQLSLWGISSRMPRSSLAKRKSRPAASANASGTTLLAIPKLATQKQTATRINAIESGAEDVCANVPLAKRIRPWQSRRG